MRQVLIADAVRTPFGKKGGHLAGVHPADLLGHTLKVLLERTGVPAEDVTQVIGGCIDQVGEQTANITRTAWLVAGLPESVAATTIDSQCGSSQQALTLARALIASGAAEVAIACGVESMTRVPIQCTMNGPGHPASPGYYDRYGEFVLQFESGERIAKKWGITRDETDRLGLSSQNRAEKAWSNGVFDTQIIPVPISTLDPAQPDAPAFDRDQGLRETSLEKLAQLKAVHSPTGVHTAGTASQIADGASAVLLVSEAAAAKYGLMPQVEILDSILVGSDPILMLTGPIPATRQLLDRNGLTVADIDTFEINEAFASVVLAWAREIEPDMEKVNPNGGAIAMGHPLGATGTALIAKATHELVRTDQAHALVTVCCGGGLATGSILRRVGA
ncbi:acetyl-CoA acetyltransferase [Rhodococcus sp. SRB_17]|uniref:acetyl-CoA C-acyltransferase n=1 Tax=Rhodococcus sp. OK302 TaxID=1882769 RepID=UPI000B93F09D|nr:acetyl-CoA C-acyltransferase [Rhodococcus sp. OK302]NMM84241.1 acetyl-CoA acetyltransferase [Rhodococcus sp. SRB_17]OYD69252.1 acetyl-CoA C-acetyltransferase [Rhodococcus sp. OK302]